MGIQTINNLKLLVSKDKNENLSANNLKKIKKQNSDENGSKKNSNNN